MGLFSEDKVEFTILDLNLSGQEVILPGSRYVSIRLLSARLKKTRVGWNKFYLCTYTRLSLYYHNDVGIAEFHKVVSPNFFKDIDPNNLDRVHQIDKPLFGPVPYQGGLEFDAGIFAVKTKDLLAPYISMLESASVQASLPFASSAIPFVGLVKSGAEELLGQSQDTKLEAGLSRGFKDDELRTGVYAVIRNDSEDNLSDLTYDGSAYRLLNADGSEFKDAPYFVYEVLADDKRNDWRSIPELSIAWKDFSKGLADMDFDNAYRAFVRACLGCVDLLEADKDRLIDIAKQQIDRYKMIERATALESTTGESTETVLIFPEFEDISLFEDDPVEAPELSSFDNAMQFVLRWEGGYVNHPNDPGGATNKGITQRVFDKWRRNNGLPEIPVLNITDAEVHQIYHDNYWLKAKCQKLEGRDGLQLAMFDTAINMGTRRAMLILQEALSVKVDGLFGPKTLDAALTKDLVSTLTSYCDIRERVYRFLVTSRPKLAVFLRGWLNRLNALRSRIGLPSLESVFIREHSSTTPMFRVDDLDETEFLEGWISDPAGS